MRFRTIAIALVVTTGLAQTGSAFAPHKGTGAPVVAAEHAPRLHRSVGYTAPAALAPRLGSLATWSQIWDRDTDVPLRMWGPSIPVFASTANADVAESAARQFLAEHLEVLAPGAAAGDFTLISNQLDGTHTIRTVGFQQYAHGLRVVGGTIAITFERDHLVMVSSTALPHVTVRMPGGVLPAATLEQSAQQFLAGDNVSTHVLGRGDRVIVPMIHERGTRPAVEIDYSVAETVRLEADRESGRWDVWLDASNGAAIARTSLLMFATGTINFDVPDRYPAGGRSPHPAPQDTHTINGAMVTSGLDGSVTFTGASPATVTPGLAGPLVSVVNNAGASVSDTLSLADGGSVTWSMANDAASDAQLDTFVFASTAKQFARTQMTPSAQTLAFLDRQNVANVNVNQTCNAQSDGDTEYFFIAGSQGNLNCENTGRIADVVYHEFGHSLHNNSAIPGEGAFESSLSEGLADTLAVSITGDHGMGRGFLLNDQPLRDVDPVGIEKKWPDDADGEPHDEGEIIGEALYDLRKALQDKYGTDAGFHKFVALYYGVMQHSADIPSSFPAVLLVDDDDGDLSNGTPDQCAIQTAFGLHGLVGLPNSGGLLTVTTPTITGRTVALDIHSPPGDPSCPYPFATAATLTWKLAGGTASDLPLAASGATYSAELPAQPSGSVVLYHVTVTLSNGKTLQFPDNPADPEYQLYVGAVTPIKCFDFEAGIGEWTHAGMAANRDEWEAGAPLGIGGDPIAAHGGSNVLGQDLGDGVGNSDGQYRGNGQSWAISPAIDLGGFTHVRLQYYRWLGVEDGAYDQAKIFANDTQVWTNFVTPGTNPFNEVNHVDKEWRFQDIDLTPQATGPITLKFEIDADQGLEFSGWNLDDVCLVGVADPALCGNGAVDPGETCDDGNQTDGDGCSAACQSEIVACPDGSGDCGPGGCCSAARDPSGAIGLSLLTLGLVFRRRRGASR